MEKKKIFSAVVEIKENYGIVKCKEGWIRENGKPFGKIETWYDVCLEKGEGDIVASFKTIKEARDYIKENAT
jgi:hypothetical protein